MEKTNGYYVAKYLKNNALVLVCELIVVLLLSLICAIIMEAEPMWLAPLIAVVTYLIAEVRFMMAYVATNARHEQEMAKTRGEDAEQTEESADEAEPSDAENAVAAAAVMAEQDGDDETEQASVPEEADLEPEETPEQESTDGREEQETSVPVLDVPASGDVDMDEEDEAVDALFAFSEAETAEDEISEQEIALEPIDISADDLDDMTMDDGDLVRNVLEIGEIEIADEQAQKDEDPLF